MPKLLITTDHPADPQDPTRPADPVDERNCYYIRLPVDDGGLASNDHNQAFVYQDIKNAEAKKAELEAKFKAEGRVNWECDVEKYGQRRTYPGTRATPVADVQTSNAALRDENKRQAELHAQEAAEQKKAQEAETAALKAQLEEAEKVRAAETAELKKQLAEAQKLAEVNRVEGPAPETAGKGKGK
jgi:hypothetical protein